MKLMLELLGGLFILLAAAVPLPDSGLVTVFFFTGGCFCVCALSMGITPVLQEIAMESEERHIKVLQERLIAANKKKILESVPQLEHADQPGTIGS